ncbi:ATP-binding protein [Ktedonosporobacter rubrisoli]|uniref:ATP-binding protein n=1 Tax=Ktedonosporobacter rubrisoli TaxID=2509675 RepID=A0A4P6K1A2_KTERU|nr:ATP-binding protein [Ktedonosporobacter rubrisoli]QBD81854.1 ATP-binding protein [Ktedonosporobacter rubrisoli]
MTQPLLILITGLPASGKTTLAKHIAAEFHFPLITKDGIKELLFDQLGWKDRAWSRQLSSVTYALLFHFIELQLSAGQPVIAESNFARTDEFLALKRRYAFEIFQIKCFADGLTLFQRFKERAEAGIRHPGHVDQQTYEELKPLLLRGKDEPLNIGGTYYEIDTTDFLAIDYKKLFAAIRATSYFTIPGT